VKEKVLDVFVAQAWHHQLCCDEGYNLSFLSQLYEQIKKFNQLQTSKQLHHQLFLINRKLMSNK
jgi:hypothetical protein